MAPRSMVSSSNRSRFSANLHQRFPQVLRWPEIRLACNLPLDVARQRGRAGS